MSNNKFSPPQDDDDSGNTGTGSEVHFRYRDAMSLGPRDDELPLADIRHFMAIHKDIHKDRVDKQRILLNEREALKAGKKPTSHYQVGQERGNYKTHWLSSTAQFSGIDKQVTQVPNQNEANTNDQLKDELQNRLNYKPGQKFHPKPQFH